MKAILISVFLFLFVSSFAQKKQSLFNGKNLKGWTIYVNDPNISPENFFYVKDGVIETPGVPVGYLRTNKEYENYQLHVEWRYPEKPINSGVLLHVNGPDKIWVTHYQAQLKHENAGDIVVHGVGEKAKIRDSVYVSTETVKPVVPKLHPSNEKPAGEWNSYDITCKGNTVEIKVNDLLQNIATNCTLIKGGIGLQAEGSRIQFRNLWIRKIK
ncbi:MAG: DUF1080 domain-containing protein [Bacteroidota bacterium]|nr:hypothetical protein [Odoribacter sp.]MDP3645159.1 DUF1080 domain-containing protein [Bacteroidota bacterium]